MAKFALTILGIRGIPAAHGGFETFAHHLALWLRDRDWDVTVYCQGSETGKREETFWEGIRLIHIPVRRDNAIGTIEFDIKSTQDALKQPGKLLTLGYNTGFLALLPRRKRITNIINMDGLEWKRAKYSFGAKSYLWVNERLAAHAGDILVADHPVIADHLATRVARSKITMIPYGSEAVTQADAAQLAPLGLEPGRFLTVIARAEPENSILEIVRAFTSKPRDAKLVILGKYSDASPYHAAVKQAGNDQVLFPGAIYDPAIIKALRFYSLAYVHGHQVGGTNPSLVEALGAGNPVIAHDNPFNRWVAQDGGVYFANEAECAQRIDMMLADEGARTAIGKAARARWESNFTWPMILEEYRRLLESA